MMHAASWPPDGYPRSTARMLVTPFSESRPMAGSHTLRVRGGSFAAALVVSLLTFAGHARAQNPSPPVPPTGTPGQILSDVVDSELTTPEPSAGLMTVPQPSYFPGSGLAPPGTRVELGLFDTITESVFGTPDPDTWRPLPLATFFSEGWNEAWVPSPNGSGGAAARLDQCHGR